MAVKTLKNTKEIKRKTKSKENEKDENVYKIDFEKEIEEEKNELLSMKNKKTKKISQNIKQDEDEDDIDYIFGNVNKWLTNNEEIEEDKKVKDEEEIDAAQIIKKAISKKRTKKNIEEVEQKEKAKIPKKRGRKPKKELLVENEEINEKSDKTQIFDTQNAIKMHTENNLTEILLEENKYKIEMQKNEYNIYTGHNETSYIIVREQSLRIVCGGVYILIEKQENDYTITTNQDFKINYIIDEVERKNNIVNFKLTNLTEIIADGIGLSFIIDEEKIIENNLEDNKTLIISEEDGKVYLPYTKEEVKQEVLQNKGIKVEEVLENKYILPLDKYKNSARARFREGYNLMYKKEKKSKKSAILLGIELMFETNLHPAIISACKTLEELDIYLDCLEDNELEKFSCFKIIYKSLPTLRKKSKFQEI